MEGNRFWDFYRDISSKKGISELVINGPKTVFVERDGKFIQLNMSFTKQEIEHFIHEIGVYNKKKCDHNNPILDGKMPDGSRINVITEPYAQGFPAITIRKYALASTSFDQSPGVFGLTPLWIQFLQACVQSRLNVVVTGGTGVGKTTLLNLLLSSIPESERLVIIEDTIELSCNHRNCVRLELMAETSVKTKSILQASDLVKNTLRMRPDRIIMGESRGGELFDLLQAMNTGHEGSMTSVHANSPYDCLIRMESLYMMAGYDLPHEVMRKQIADAVDLIIHIGRSREGGRYISTIAEVTGMEQNTVLMQKVAERDGDVLKFSGITPKNLKVMNDRIGFETNFFSSF